MAQLHTYKFTFETLFGGPTQLHWERAFTADDAVTQATVIFSKDKYILKKIEPQQEE